MIRPARPADRPAVLSVAVTSGLFPPDGVDELAARFDARPEGDEWLVDDDGGGPVAVLLHAPDAMADRVRTVLLIAVNRAEHGRGRGRALMGRVEAELAAQGTRLLLVETSGTDGFARTRGFYRMLGYDEEARIRDYYADGDDKIVFRKALLP